MINPTKEQLADPAWWDENAPDSSATFYNYFTWCKFLRLSADGKPEYFREGEWARYTDEQMGHEHILASESRPISKKQWRGPEDGLPPVGANVEIYGERLAYGDGESGEVIAHVENTAVVRISYGLGCFEACVLRPIRTPEQIAAEERESHVLAMLCYDPFGGSRRGLAEALYDAGYRKCSE